MRVRRSLILTALREFSEAVASTGHYNSTKRLS